MDGKSTGGWTDGNWSGLHHQLGLSWVEAIGMTQSALFDGPLTHVGWLGDLLLWTVIVAVLSVYIFYGVQVRELQTFLSLVCLIRQYAGFPDIILVYSCAYRPNSPWKLIGKHLSLLPGTGHLSVYAMWLVLDWLFVNPGAVLSFILKTESDIAFKMKSLRARQLEKNTALYNTE